MTRFCQILLIFGTFQILSIILITSLKYYQEFGYSNENVKLPLRHTKFSRNFLKKKEWDFLLAANTTLSKEDAEFPSLQELNFLKVYLEQNNVPISANETSKRKVLFLIPYRKRALNLLYFLYYMLTYLQDRGVYHKFLIVEQSGAKKFRRGNLFNAGVLLAEERFPDFDCFCLHDVDNLPLYNITRYDCVDSGISQLIDGVVSQGGGVIQRFYPELLGGVTMVAKEAYVKANGMSNSFSGWGGEDDNFRIRAELANITITREYQSVFYTIDHPDDRVYDTSRFRKITKEYVNHTYQTDGLNSFKYELMIYEENDFFSRAVVILLN